MTHTSPSPARARRCLAAAAGVAAALALAACSSSPSNSGANASTSTNAAAVKITSIPSAERSAPGSSSSEPNVTVPSGSAPSNLESADLIPGSGPAAVPGDKLTVQYTLATYSSGKVIQSSWTSNQPFGFTLGAGQVIPGWDKGVVGMKAGGRRELIIPASLGYGSQSPGPGIAPNDTLVFVVDLQKIG